MRMTCINIGIQYGWRISVSMSRIILDISSDLRLTRIERVLSYIHCHLDDALSVESLAAQSCWSRWQFQRVFTAATGFTVAQYVRQLRLSRAAELLISTPLRQLDIALSCGFDTEISFSRSFRQMFGCPPGTYRQRGQRSGMLASINLQDAPRLPPDMHKPMLSIRVEHRPAFNACGLSAPIKGLFAESPDFVTSVPQLWARLSDCARAAQLTPDTLTLIGVLDLTQAEANQGCFPYWACMESGVLDDGGDNFSVLQVPAQEYAVIPHHGPLESLQKVLEWFIRYWLPESGYRGVNGFDLEIYDHRFHPGQADSYMEYWVPIKPRQRLAKYHPVCSSN